MDNLTGAIVLSGLFGIYWIPTIIAVFRDHNNGAAIVFLNLFLGWTFLGWVVALVWSVTDNVAASKE